MFYYETIDNKRILRSDFIEQADAFFTTRDFCLCNKKELTLDEEKSLKSDKKIISDFLNIDVENLISPEQTHSTNIEVVTNLKKIYSNCDGLILKDKNIGIFLNFADCTPIILYDTVKNVGAVVHAGWRGTAGMISKKVLNLLTENFNSKPVDIVALIGPAIGFCCYDVGEDVFNKLSDSVDIFDDLYEIREGRIFVDLKNINRRQLEEVGVKKIDVCPYCTVNDNDKFYSYRNENATTKRHSAILKLAD